jgi:hypothetical protein
MEKEIGDWRFRWRGNSGELGGTQEGFKVAGKKSSSRIGRNTDRKRG